MGSCKRAVVGDQLEIFALMALIRGGTPAALAVRMAIEARLICTVSVVTFSTVLDARIIKLKIHVKNLKNCYYFPNLIFLVLFHFQNLCFN